MDLVGFVLKHAELVPLLAQSLNNKYNLNFARSKQAKFNLKDLKKEDSGNTFIKFQDYHDGDFKPSVLLVGCTCKIGLESVVKNSICGYVGCKSSSRTSCERCQMGFCCLLHLKYSKHTKHKCDMNLRIILDVVNPPHTIVNAILNLHHYKGWLNLGPFNNDEIAELNILADIKRESCIWWNTHGPNAIRFWLLGEINIQQPDVMRYIATLTIKNI